MTRNDSNKISIAEIENTLNDFHGDSASEREYIGGVLTNGEIYGDGDDFHNLAVRFAKLDDYENACSILESGLARHSHNVDLLADYLKYGIACGKMKQCETYFERLCKIPKRRWTWRGYDFAVDYLMYLAENEESDEELNKKVEDMLELATLYRAHEPREEGSYQVEASIYRFINDHEKEIAVLQSALDEVKVCPKCGLRLADKYFEYGEIDKALTILRRTEKDGINTQMSVNIGYVYYLTALCLAILIHENHWFGDMIKLQELYEMFRLAKHTLPKNSNYSTMLEQQISIFEDKTGKKFDEDGEDFHKNTPSSKKNSSKSSRRFSWFCNR